MGAAWGRQGALDCQAEGNSETALKAGRGRDQPSEPSVQGISGAPPGGCGVSGTCRCSLDLLAPLQTLAGLRCCAACPVRAGGGSTAAAALLLPGVGSCAAELSSGEEQLPHSSNSRDSYNALPESSRTTRIGPLHND